MSVLIDYKYVNLLAVRLLKFKLKKPSPLLAVARCPKCGDSQKNSNKVRFYIYEKSGVVRTMCHNCGYSAKLGWFIKEFFPDLHKQYLLDLFQENRIERQADHIITPKKPAAEKVGGVLKGLKRISQLSHNHPAKRYIESRKLPPESHSRLYFTENFQLWINALIPEKFKKTPKFDPRIIIPFFDQKGNVFAVQGRAISSKQGIRYITIKFDEDHPKVFGLDRIDTNFRVWVLEGPLDALFIDNALAMAGADVSNEQLLQLLGIDKDRIVKVYDNEPRNVDVIRRMERDIADGYKVVIWPQSIHTKDINKMVLDQALSPKNITMLMKAHTYDGLDAKLKLSRWCKVVTSRS